MGTGKVGKSCSRTPRKPESGGESAGNRWKGVETTIRMGTVKVGKSCSRTPRKPQSGGESAGDRWKGVETRIRMGTVTVGKSCSRKRRKTTQTVMKSPKTPQNSESSCKMTVGQSPLLVMGSGGFGTPCSRTAEKHVFRPRKRPEIPTEPAGKTVSSETPEIPRTPGRGDFPSVY